MSVQRALLPRLARHIILTRLAEIGLPEAALEVRSCSWHGAELANVNLGKDRCASISSLSVQYSLRSLLRGKLKKLQVTGGQLLLRIRDGRISLGELAQLRLGDNDQGGESVCERIELRACMLSIHWQDRPICIPCEGSIVSSGSGWIIQSLKLNLQGTPAQIRADLFTRGESLAFSLEQQDLDLRALAAVLPTDGFNIPARLAGRASVKLQGDISLDEDTAVLRLSLTDVWLKTALAGLPVNVEGMACQLTAALKDGFQLEDLAGDISLEVLKLGEVPAHGIHIRVDKVADELCLSGEAEGEKWRLKQCSARLPAAFHPKGEQSLATVSWELEGQIPKRISQMLSEKGLNISRLGMVTMSGQGLMNLSTLANKSLPDIEVPELHVVVSPGELRIDPGDVVLRDFSGSLRVRGDCRQARATVHLLPDSWLKFNSARVGAVMVGTGHLALKGIDDQSAAEFAFDEGTLKTNVNLKVQSSGATLRSSNDRLKCKVGPTELSIRANLGTELSTARATLAIEQAESHLSHPRLSLALQKAVVDANLTSGGPNGPAIETVLDLKQATLLHDKSEALLVLDKQVWRPILGSFNLTQRKGEFTWQWPVQENVMLQAEAYLGFDKRQPSGLLSVACAGFSLAEQQSTVKMLADLTGMDVTGQFSLEGHLRLQRGRWVPRVTIKATDAAVSSERYQAEADGINGSVTFTGLSPISTPGNQHLEVRSFKLGKLHLQDGLIAFRVENKAPGVFIERTEWGWLGGRLYTHALRMDPNYPRIDMRLFADGLDLSRLLALAFGQSAAGQGTLYGTIPVSVSRSDWADFGLGEGFLYAGDGTGWWKLHSDRLPGIMRKALDQPSGATLPESEQISRQEMILTALLDFEYSKLKVDFVRETDGITARVTTRGRCRSEKIPLEFEEIVLDFPRFDRNLQQVILLKKVVNQSLEQRQR